MRLRWLFVGILLLALLVPAVALTAARSLEPASGWWVRLVSFTPYAIPLYALALLVLLGVLAARHRSRSRGVGWLTVLVVAGLGLHLVWVGGPYVGHPGVVADGGHGFTVMTSNLKLGEADPSRVVELAVEDHVDILVLEEVTPQVLGAMQAAGLGQAFPSSAGQAQAGPKGTMVFSTHKISGVTGLKTLSGGYEMTVQLPGGAINLLAVHPTSPTRNVAGWWADQHTILHAAEATREATVLAGDFNATMDHAPVRALLGDGFSDAATQAKSGWQPTWPASDKVTLLGIPLPSMLQLDHVFVDDHLRAVHTDTVSIDGTDHRALIARLVQG